MAKATNELIDIHIKLKNIVFSKKEREDLEKVIQKYNYSNVMSLKWLFATSREEKLVYKMSTEYFDLKKKFFELYRFERKIRESVLMYETELKYYFVQFLVDFFQKENIDFKEFTENLFDNYKKEFVTEKLNLIFNSEWESQVKYF